MGEKFVTEGRLDRERAAAELRRFVDLLLKETRFTLRCEIKASPDPQARPDDPEITVTFRGADEELLLEKQAQLLLALEHIATEWLGLGPGMHDRIRFDCGEYRAQRIEELRLSARMAADRVRETRQPFRFGAMSSRERRTIHLALADLPGIRTESEGLAEHRHIVVYPVDSKK